MKEGCLIMFKKLIILTKSRKHGGYCIAGVDIHTGEWIRIISDDIESSTDEITERQLTYINGQVVDILNIVKVKCKEFKPYYYQPENYVLDSSTQFTKLGEASLRDVLNIHGFEKKDFIYFNSDYRVENSFINNMDDKNKYSLVLIKVTNPSVNVSVKPWSSCGEKSVTLSFFYNHYHYNYFRITDDDFASEYHENECGNYQLHGNYALVISLGELYKINSSHYKLIAKIFEL